MPLPRADHGADGASKIILHDLQVRRPDYYTKLLVDAMPVPKTPSLKSSAMSCSTASRVGRGSLGIAANNLGHLMALLLINLHTVVYAQWRREVRVRGLLNALQHPPGADMGGAPVIRHGM
jgi:hypothetical protein